MFVPGGVVPILPVQPADLLPLIQSRTACVPPPTATGLCVTLVPPPTGRMRLCVKLVPPPTGRMGLLALRLFCLRSHPFVMLNSA